MGLRFNPPPQWPVPAGFTPPPGWLPDPGWPAAPLGWELWVNDDTMPGPGPGPDPAQGFGFGPPGNPFGPPADPFGPPADPSGLQPHQVYAQAVVPEKPGVNGAALAGFIVSLIGGVLVGAILCIVGLVQIGKRPQRGRGLAIAGLALTGVWIAGIVAVLAVNATSQAHRSATGTITKSGHAGRVLAARRGLLPESAGREGADQAQ